MKIRSSHEDCTVKSMHKEDYKNLCSCLTSCFAKLQDLLMHQKKKRPVHSENHCYFFLIYTLDTVVIFVTVSLNEIATTIFLLVIVLGTGVLIFFTND